MVMMLSCFVILKFTDLPFSAEPLSEEQLVEKEELIARGFEDWSRRDFQQFVRALETYGWTDDYELLASEIQDKSGHDVAQYYPIFRKKWKELAGMLIRTSGRLSRLIH